MKYIFTTYKKRLIAAIVCLALLLPLNLSLHGLYKAWPQFATKYSYLEDAQYRDQPLISITPNGYANLENWNEEYISTWTYFFTEQVEAEQLLRTVTLPDDTIFDIRLSATEVEGIQSFIADGITEFGVRTCWTYIDGAWEGYNTDLVTGEGTSDPFLRKYTTRGTLQPEHLQNIQSIMASSGETDFLLHNDIVLPDGLRREVHIDRTGVDQALIDIAAGNINGLQVITSWKVKSQAIWMHYLPDDNSHGAQTIINLMRLSHQDNYHDFMLWILDRIVDLQIIGNLTLIMAAFIIGLTIYAQEKKRRT